jgi:DHA1 family purine base/nucleoside efflux pump-like MFS transporter
MKPSTKVARRVLIATLVPQFAFGLSYAWIGLAPHVEQQSHWSAFAIGAIFTLPLLSSALTLLFSEYLTAFIAPRRLCWLGVGLLLVGLTVAFVWPGEAVFIIFYAILALGVGYGMTFAASLAAIAQVFPRRVATVSGIITASYALSALVEVPVVNALIVGHFWLDALRIAGASVAVLAGIAVVFMPYLPVAHQQTSVGRHTLHLLRQPRFGTVVLITVLVAPLGTYATSEVGIYAQSLHLLAALATAAVVVVAAGTVLGRLLGGVLSDHLGADRVLLVVVALDALAGIVLWRASSAPVFLGATAVIGLTCGGLVGAVPRLALDNAPGAFSTAAGLLFAGFSLGGFIGPVIGTALGGRTLAWFVLALLTVVGFAILLLHLTLFARQALQPRASTTGSAPSRS